MKFLFILLLLPCFIKAQKGSINGKVQYRYNEYVKDRPDVGAKIILIAKNDKKFRQEAIVDLQGSYNFPDLDPREYLLISTSKNSKEDPVNSFESLSLYSDFLNNWSDDFSGIFITKSYDSLQRKITDYKLLRDTKKISERKLQNVKTEIDVSISKFFSGIPATIADRLNIKSPLDKMKFEVIRVPAKEINVVTDFGLLSH